MELIIRCTQCCLDDSLTISKRLSLYFSKFYSISNLFNQITKIKNCLFPAVERNSSLFILLIFQDHFLIFSLPQ